MEILHFLLFFFVRGSLCSDLLPTEYPKGELSQTAFPIFMQTPEPVYYAIRNAPAELVCKVAHALSVYFKCNGEDMKNTDESQIVDPETSIRYTEVKLKVSKVEAKDVLGKFTCKCVAISGKGQKESNLTEIKTAFLYKRFETDPYSQSVKVDGQAILQCHPPKGDPVARITHWIKDGEIVNAKKDPNLIQNADGDLIIVQARMDDAGNYTCVADNGVQKRKSNDATVKVYVPGQWGSWSEWSDCNAECGHGLRERTRLCNSPAPLNGGPKCAGVAVKKEACQVECAKVHGAWSEWAAWGPCTEDCKRYRERFCTNPAPANNGRYCQSDSKGNKEKSEEFCDFCTPVHPTKAEDYGTETNNLDLNANSNSGPTTADLTLLVGLVFAFLIFIVVVFVIVRLLRRKGHGGHQPERVSTLENGYRLAPSSSGYGIKANNYSPDIISHIRNNEPLPTSSFNYNSYSDKNSYHSGNSSNSNTHRAFVVTNNPRYSSDVNKSFGEHLYEQPMIVFPPSKSPADSLERTPFIDDKVSSSSSGGQPSPVTFHHQQSMPSHLKVPKGIDPQCVSWSPVAKSGTKISIPRSSVSMTIPQGAINNGSTLDMFISVLHSDKYKPNLDTSQTSITPVIQCGPTEAGNFLQKPVVISIPHSGGSGVKRLMVLHCSDVDRQDAEWEIVSGLNDNNKFYMQVDSTLVHLVTENLGAYVLVANVIDLNQIGGVVGSMANSSSGYSSSLGSPADSHQKMSPGTKQALCRTLDVPSCEGKGWQQLAEVLGAEHFISFFATQPSPSEALLSLWENRNRDIEPLKNLAEMLKLIRREDAVVILERDLKL